jgi:hypothetical protein
MTDLLLIAVTMLVIVYASYFIYTNDGDGNARPDKTLFAMEEDRAAVPKKRSRFATPPPPQGPSPGSPRA